MRIGFLGGSFDPVHEGHLALARACRDGADLDHVVFIVAGTPPHKLDRELAPADHRLKMVRLAVAGDPTLSVDDLEIRRRGVGYTIHTVEELTREHPGDECWWIIGADTLPELPTWREAERLVDMIGILSATRPGFEVAPAIEQLARALGRERADRIASGFIEMSPAAVSSTQIRRRIAAGRPIDGLLPADVVTWISRHGLYT